MVTIRLASVWRVELLLFISFGSCDCHCLSFCRFSTFRPLTLMHPNPLSFVFKIYVGISLRWSVFLNYQDKSQVVCTHSFPLLLGISLLDQQTKKLVPFGRRSLSYWHSEPDELSFNQRKYSPKPRGLSTSVLSREEHIFPMMKHTLNSTLPVQQAIPFKTTLDPDIVF